MRERDRSVDVLRGIGMLFVIIGHIFDGQWTRYIFSFHMPLFFFLSGFCLRKKERLDPPAKYLGKKCRSLLVPYVIFFFVCLALENLRFAAGTGFYLKNSLSVTAVLKALILSGGYLNTIPLANFPLWFLPHLFAADMIFYFIIRAVSCVKDKRSRLAAELLITAGLILITLPVQRAIPGRPALHVNVFPASLSFFMLGWLSEPLPRTKIWKMCSPCACPLLLIAGYLLNCLNGGGNISNILTLIYYPCAMCSILGFYGLSERFESPVLTYIGRNAIVFLGLHIFVFLHLTNIPRPGFLTNDVVYDAMRLVAGFLILSLICEAVRLAKRLWARRPRAGAGD